MIKQKEKYPFWMRLFVGVPAALFLSVMIIILTLSSTESLGKALKNTGEKLLK